MKNKKVLAIVMAVMTGCIRSCRLRLYRSNSSCGYRCDDGKKGRYHSGSSSDD